MNSATRVLSELSQASDGTTENESARLLAAVSVAGMGETDDATRPFTSWLTYLESVLPGVAVERIRAQFGGQLARESQR